MANLISSIGGAAQSLSGILSSKTRVSIMQQTPIPGVAITVVQLDASLSETHTSTVNPSEFPIENGTVISDFLIVRPFELSITGIISDNPIGGFTNLLTEGVASLASALVPPASVTALSGAAGLLGLKSPSPSVAAYLKLLKLQQAGNAVTILTTLNRYMNMFITSISVPRDAANGKILLFTMKARQLLLVSAQYLPIGVQANSALSASNAVVGTQSTVAAQFTAGQVIGNGITGE